MSLVAIDSTVIIPGTYETVTGSPTTHCTSPPPAIPPGGGSGGSGGGPGHGDIGGSGTGVEGCKDPGVCVPPSDVKTYDQYQAWLATASHSYEFLKCCPGGG